MNWVRKLERKFSRYAIRDLMTYIVVINAVVYVLEMLVPQSNLFMKFYLNPSLVMRGEIWRLITFLFLPHHAPYMDHICPVFLLSCWQQSENQWGSFRFNLYYLIGGYMHHYYFLHRQGTVTTEHLNLSLFLAFAYLFPTLRFCFSSSFLLR